MPTAKRDLQAAFYDQVVAMFQPLASKRFGAAAPAAVMPAPSATPTRTETPTPFATPAFDPSASAGGTPDAPPRHTKAEQARINGAKSRGPTTPEGKEASSKNAVRHGLCAQGMILPGEDPAEYQRFVRDFVQDLRATGPVQVFLAERAALQAWKLRRMPRLEAIVLYVRRDEEREPGADIGAFGDLVHELSGADTDGGLLRLHRYEQRIERSLRACLKELRLLQATMPMGAAEARVAPTATADTANAETEHTATPTVETTGVPKAEPDAEAERPATVGSFCHGHAAVGTPADAVNAATAEPHNVTRGFNPCEGHDVQETREKQQKIQLRKRRS
jgi:hypothetical protein